MSDKKFGVISDTNSSLIDHYEADIVGATDYYPFGMPSRVSLTGKGYRFGFNGKENDNDVKGWGNQQDYGMRIYDPRIGKFISNDPLSNESPEFTPYGYAYNNPIVLIDAEGLKGTPPDPPGKITVRYGNRSVEVKGSINTAFSKEDLARFIEERAGEYVARSKPPEPPRVTKWIKYARYLNWIRLGIETLTFDTHGYGHMAEVLGNDQYLDYNTLKGLQSSLKHNNQFNNFEIITTNPGTLPDWYLQDVKKRLLDGTASENDRMYKDELVERGMLSPKFGGKQNFGQAPSSDVLGRNMEKAGQVRLHISHAAHHIVAGSDRRSAAARRILAREGIDINDADNGVFLETGQHNKIHTNDYYDKLTRRLNAAGKGNVRKELQKIRKEIKEGTF